jgi:arylsulfatase A-like enzyme
METFGAGGAVGFLTREPKEPFFLSVGLGDPHRKGRGFAPPPDYASQTDPRFVKVPDPLPDTAATRRDMADYIDSARSMDRQMGEVLEALHRMGLADRTLVVCTTDHGIAFPDMKCNLTDHGLGVMLMVRGPGIQGGRAVDAMVSHVDLYPTLCEAAGIEPPDWRVGESLWPLLHGRANAVRTELFAELNVHAAYEPQRAIRTDRWKYIRSFGKDRPPPLTNCDESPSKDLWMEHGWRQNQNAPPVHRLYDLVFDPQERQNLADSPDHGQILKDLRERLERWMRETDDPLLHGAIPIPEGAKVVVNAPDSVEPSEPVQTWQGEALS